MTDRDIATLTKRLKYWEGILHEQHSIKKNLRSESTIADAKLRISTINGWLSDKPEVTPVEKEEIMSLQAFRDHMKSLGLDPKAAKQVMIIESRKQIDQMWSWLHKANVQLQMSKELAEYFRQKMDRETDRLYKSITK